MLTGTTNEEKIWNYLTAAGLNEYGAAGLMGNLYAESGLIPANLQNTCEKKLGYTDAAYTAAVDNGSYTSFATDSAGYGLAQWTYHTRKAALLAFVQAAGKSVGDLETQLAFLMKELGESYKAVLSTLKTATSVRAASDAVLVQFERPADQSEAAKAKRAGYGQTYYDKYAEKGNDTAMGFSNSSLATVTLISPNKTSPRTHAIDTITIHCFVGQVTAKRGCEVFQPSSKQASCNYVVGKDGDIGLCVEEKDRSWCSSNAANDHRAITIEVASDATDPYAITDKAMTALIELCADICKRNGIAKLVWSTVKNTRVNHLDGCNMTVHRDYAAKSCPGDYIYQRLGDIAAAVNKKLGAVTTTTTATTTTTTQSTTEKKATEAAKSRDNTLAGTYTVTAGSGLHIRNGAGTGKASLAVLPSGTKVQNYGYYTAVGNVKWLYVQVTHNGVKYTGFCSAEYLKK